MRGAGRRRGRRRHGRPPRSLLRAAPAGFARAGRAAPRRSGRARRRQRSRRRRATVAPNRRRARRSTRALLPPGPAVLRRPSRHHPRYPFSERVCGCQMQPFGPGRSDSYGRNARGRPKSRSCLDAEARVASAPVGRLKLSGLLGLIALACVVLPAAVGAAPVAATANTTTYTDSTGENPAAPDITTIVVSNNDAGIISFKINVPNRAVADAGHAHRAGDRLRQQRRDG